MPTAPPTVKQTTGSRTTSTATVNDNTCYTGRNQTRFVITGF